MLVSLSARTRRNTLRLRAANKHRLALIRNFSLKRREGNFGANPPSHEATADVDSVPSASSGQASPPHLPCKRGIRLRTRLRRTGFASLKILRPVRESERASPFWATEGTENTEKKEIFRRRFRRFTLFFCLLCVLGTDSARCKHHQKPSLRLLVGVAVWCISQFMKKKKRAAIAMLAALPT